MQTQSSSHFFVNWAKERLDEMDATLTSLEDKVGGVQADARDKANKALADLRKKRDDFRDIVKKQSEANEAAWTSAKTKLRVSVERLRGGSQKIRRELRQENRATAGDFQASIRRPTESMARSGRQAWQVRQRIRSRTSGRNRCGREAHDHRCHRGGGKTPEAKPSRGPVMVRTNGCPDGNAHCLRSCQSGSDGCVQASRLIKTADWIRRDRREAVFLFVLNDQETTFG